MQIERALVAVVAGQRPDGNKRIVAKYDYTDAAGALLYQVLRLEPKSFRQRRPDGNGGWTWELDERRVPYQWPELLKYPDGTVFVCEGEKDADRVANTWTLRNVCCRWQVDKKMRRGARWTRRYHP